METREKFSIRKRLQSFGYAFSGLCRFFRTEHNVWIHSVAAITVLILGWLLDLSRMEWIGVLFAIGFVLSAEAFNTVIEKLADRVSDREDERIKYIKDLAAGAVLIAAITAAAIGLIIFVPKIF